jgi:hypothetical protein
MSDIFSKFLPQGSFGQAAGGILADRRKGNKKEFLQFLALESLVQGLKGYNTAQTQARDEAVADLSLVSQPLISGLKSEYSQNNSKREKLRQYNDPTTRDDFLYNEALSSLNTFANEVSQGKVFTVKELENNPQYKTALNNRLQSKIGELSNYYDLLNQDPLYSSKTQEEYVTPYLENFTAKRKLIEDDPRKQGAFNSFINMQFGDGTSDLLDLKTAVEDTTAKINEREAKQAFVKRLLQGDLARLEGMGTEQEFLATSKFGKIMVDNVEFNKLANGISSTAENNDYKDYVFNGENLLKSNNLKNMKVVSPDGQESRMSPFAALGNSTAKVALFLKDLDTQSKNLGEDVELKSDTEYVDNALNLLFDTQAITEDSIISFDNVGFRKIKDALKSQRDFPGMDAAAISAYMDKAQLSNAVDIDIYLQDAVADDYNMLRRQLIKTQDADKKQELIDEMTDLRKIYTGLGDLSEGLPIEDRNLLQRMDKSRLIEILNLSENDNSYIKIGNITKRGYEFDYDIKKEFYKNYIGEYGADADLKNLLNDSKPENSIQGFGDFGGPSFPPLKETEGVDSQVKEIITDSNLKEERPLFTDGEIAADARDRLASEAVDVAYNFFKNQQIKNDKKRLQSLIDGQITKSQESLSRRRVLPKYNLPIDASESDILNLLEQL